MRKRRKFRSSHASKPPPTADSTFAVAKWRTSYATILIFGSNKWNISLHHFLRRMFSRPLSAWCINSREVCFSLLVTLFRQHKWIRLRRHSSNYCRRYCMGSMKIIIIISSAFSNLFRFGWFALTFVRRGKNGHKESIEQMILFVRITDVNEGRMSMAVVILLK